MAERKFTHSRATRERVPIVVGLAGPTGGGKTYSALRLATGMQRVVGGRIFVIDTEARRARHYAPKPGEQADPAEGTFDFEHVEFAAPFGPLDYLKAVEYVVAQGATIVIIDSMSHEHEGPGGVLEMQAKRLELKGGEERWNHWAWIEPKAQRQRFLNTIKQLGINLILCFRAKEKHDYKGGKPKELGWQPIAGAEYTYELMLCGVLPPGANGVPQWDLERPGEKQLIKLPGWAAPFFPKNQQIDEHAGEQIARWAAGDAPEPPSEEVLEEVLHEVVTAQSVQDLMKVSQAHAQKAWTPQQRQSIKQAIDKRRAELGKR